MLRTGNKLPKGSVELRKFGGKSYPYLKVTLGRLVEKGAAVKVRRGVYFIPSPENVSKLQTLRKNTVVYQIVRSIYEEFHRDLKLILIYGSYARGDFDKKSDVDVLVVSEGDGRDLAKRLSGRLGVRVDLRVVSEPYFRRLMVVEPKVHFWLKEGQVFDEGGITKGTLPIGRIGFYESLRNAELQIEAAGNADTNSLKGYYLLVALRELLTFKHALNLGFDYRNVKEDLIKLAGVDAIRKMRMSGKAPVSKMEIHRWGQEVKKRYVALRRAYGGLGINPGDLYIKKFVEKKFAGG